MDNSKFDHFDFFMLCNHYPIDLQKFNCERVQSEIEYITEFVRNACAPIEIIIQEAE